MDRDVEELRRRWERSVLLAGGRYAAGIQAAKTGGVEVLRDAITRHQKAIKKLRKMVKQMDEGRA